MALEPHDLALTKLERSNDRDIRDVLYLAQAGLITQAVLVSRFEAEFEPYVTGTYSNLEPHDAPDLDRRLLAAVVADAAQSGLPLEAFVPSGIWRDLIGS